MPMVKNVEKKIWDIEGFDVVFKQLSGSNVHGNKRDIPQYSAQKKSDKNMTVAGWKKKFYKQYPGFEVDVLDANGDVEDGHTKLQTVRATYLNAENAS